MDVFYAYTYGSGAWLALQGLTLVSTPKLILAMLLDDARQASHSDLEIYFSRSCGFALVTLALMTIVLTGSIPLTSTVVEPISTDDENDPKAPYAVPTVLLTALFHATCAFYNYSWYVHRGHTALAIGTVGSGLTASLGLWCLLFGSSGGRISRRTGVDKRTAGFPFKNTQAYKRSPNKSGKNL